MLFAKSSVVLLIRTILSSKDFAVCSAFSCMPNAVLFAFSAWTSRISPTSLTLVSSFDTSSSSDLSWTSISFEIFSINPVASCFDFSTKATSSINEVEIPFAFSSKVSTF
ncbi:MAG: hypothetical protein BWY78_01242 [Alphaproteobacteria bacterium ADurb.Bin438]|nr:MAG: hypothetical protein BWY78_01242 [Alphaproteobacteria bacterium ADurb.Bin438]